MAIELFIENDGKSDLSLEVFVDKSKHEFIVNKDILISLSKFRLIESEYKYGQYPCLKIVYNYEENELRKKDVEEIKNRIDDYKGLEITEKEDMPGFVIPFLDIIFPAGTKISFGDYSS